MSAYGEQLAVMKRQAEIQKELEGSSDDMERCAHIELSLSPGSWPCTQATGASVELRKTLQRPESQCSCELMPSCRTAGTSADGSQLMHSLRSPTQICSSIHCLRAG